MSIRATLRAWPVLCLTAATVIAGCDEVDPDALCDPGDVRACSCGSSGAPSTQACSSDGLTWEPCECGEADGDADGDHDADLDADPDADVDDDAEGPSWDPLAGCIGGETEEQWLVAANAGGELRAFLTGRDCSDPVLLCTDCYPASLSPDGTRALIARPATASWRLDDRLDVMDLADPSHGSHETGAAGTLPVWVDDDRFVYVAASPASPEACTSPGDPPERTELRSHVLSTGEDLGLELDVGRGWSSGFPVPSPAFDHLAFGEDFSSECLEWHGGIVVTEVGTGERIVFEWSLMDDIHLPVGSLPDGSGFLVHRADLAGPSRLYAVSYGGDAQPLVLGIDATVSYFLVGGILPGFWSACGSTRQVGPACEVYCQVSTGRLLRFSLDGSDAEDVDCPLLGDHVRVMDIRQRSVE